MAEGSINADTGVDAVTGGEILNGMADLIGIKAAGETLVAADAQDLLRRLNNLVSTLRTQFGTVLSVQRTIFPLVANQQTYTIGPGGDFDVPRPVSIPSAGLWLAGLSSAVSVTSITRSGTTATVTRTSHGFSVGDEAYIDGATQTAYNGLQTVQTVPTANTFTFTVGGGPVSPATGTITVAAVDGEPVEIPRTVITDEAYQAIQLKNLSNSEFTLVYYNPTSTNSPFGTIVLWPKPDTAANQLVLYLQSAFTGFADLTTDYSYPNNPGYGEMLEYNLAIRSAAPFGRRLSDYPEVVALAHETLGLIKRANNRLVDLPSDAALLTHDRRGGYDINTGG